MHLLIIELEASVLCRSKCRDVPSHLAWPNWLEMGRFVPYSLGMCNAHLTLYHNQINPFKLKLNFNHPHMKSYPTVTYTFTLTFAIHFQTSLNWDWICLLDQLYLDLAFNRLQYCSILPSTFPMLGNTILFLHFVEHIQMMTSPEKWTKQFQVNYLETLTISVLPNFRSICSFLQV